MEEESYCHLPMKIVDNMLMMCTRISEDIRAVATEEQLADPRSTFYSMKCANELNMLVLVKTKLDVGGRGTAAQTCIH